MCSICHQIYCTSTCPGYSDREMNCEDKEPLAVCDSCGGELYSGDEAVIVEDYILCPNCIENMTVKLTPENAPIKE